MADYRENAFPEDDATRGRFPMADGLLDYFPNALAAVAEVSKIGNDKHNPGEPMHHARGKSMDHRNKIMRHLCDAGGVDAGGVRHSAYVAWRALALLQEELEAQEGAPMARAARIAMAEPPATRSKPGAAAQAAKAVASSLCDEVPRPAIMKGMPVTKGEARRMRQMLDEGMTRPEIAKALGRHLRTVHNNTRHAPLRYGKGARREVTAEVREQIRKLVDTGLSDTKIAEALDLSRSSVYYHGRGNRAAE